MSSPSRKLPAELLRKIREAVNLVDIVGEHVVLRKSGANHVGLCPFHSERTPSFSVSEGKQLYHCYGCKRGGDLFSFMMEIHGISFPEAVEELADRGRIALPAEGLRAGDSGDPEAEKRREAAREKLSTAYRLTRFVAAFYHQNLKNMPAAESYLLERGVTDELRTNFYLGAAQAGWDSLARHLVSKKAPLDLAVELGLIRASSKGAPGGIGYFDLFRARATFPILDMRGKVAGFGGRTISSLGADSEGPKYLNSPESFIFQKSKLAYGLYQAQKHIREKDEVILVEGYFDVLALHAAGFQNAVASCGTALTAEHLAVFRRFASRVTLLFDGDKAGVAATERAMELGLEQGMVLRGAAMPADLDPDEILFDQRTGQPKANGRERMQEILAQAKPLLDSRIDDIILHARQSPEAKSQAIKQVASWLARFRDPVGRQVRLDYFRKGVGVSRDLLDQAMGGRPVDPKPVPQRVISKQSPKLSRAEKVLLRGLAQDDEYSAFFEQARAKLPPNRMIADLFDYTPAREWVRKLETESGLERPFRVTADTLTQGELDPQLQSAVTEALVMADTAYGLKDFQVVLDRAVARCWARFSQCIKMALEEAEAKKDAGLQSQLMKEYLDVQRKMKEFISFYDEA